MGHRNGNLFTTWLLLLLIGAFSFGIVRIVKSNTEKGKTEEVKQVEEVKGNAETVNCSTIQPLVQSVVNSPTLERRWYLKGDGNNFSDIILEIPNTNISTSDIRFFTLKYYVDSEANSKDMEYSESEKKWLGKVNLNELEVGEHTITITSTIKDCEFNGKKELPFILSYPVYVTWTLDWEGSDVKQSNLDSIVDISSKYGIPVTHFFNPYIYYSLPENRTNAITEWVINRKNLGDSIGLHLHMYDKYVTASGVTPKTTRWGYVGYGKGYDVPTEEYSYSEFMKILSLAKSDFAKHGLGVPTLYRAGGWFADEDILKAVQDSGFKADSSGRISYTIGTNKVAGPWTLQTTTQPYLLNLNNQNDTVSGGSKLWEIPNNGLDSWSFNANQMIQAFNQNYTAGINNSTKVVTYLSHPQGFEHDNPILNQVFTHISMYSYNSDSGPVIFTTIDKLPMITQNR